MNIGENEAVKIAKAWLEEDGQDLPLIDASFISTDFNNGEEYFTKSPYWLVTFKYSQSGIEPEHLFLMVDSTNGVVEAPRMY